MTTLLRGLGGVAALSLLVGILPAILGALYAARPTEAKLALMRPVSLAAIFAALCAFTSGVMHTFRNLSIGRITRDSPVVALGLAESMVPMFVAFGCLTIAWLCVASGMRRQTG